MAGSLVAIDVNLWVDCMVSAIAYATATTKARHVGPNFLMTLAVCYAACFPNSIGGKQGYN